MSQIPSLSEGQIESLARVLGDCGTGSDINRVLSDRGLIDNSGESTKWRRIYWIFLETQRKYGCANHVLDFIQSFLTPVRFVGRSEIFEERRGELNTILAFSGLIPPGAAEADQAYRVGPGDVLEVEVYGDPDLSGLVTIQHGGEISFPLLGEVAVSGLTVKEVRATLTELLAKDYLIDPQVVVRVKEHRSQSVTLVGEVVRPGKYYLQGSKSLLDLLTEAGGFTGKASGEVMVSRPEDGGGDNGGGVLRFLVSPEQSPSQQKDALSLQLRNGDIVTATSTQFFYVSGEVKNPGSYPITPGLTVLKAVSVAGGLSKFGSKGKVEILRKVASGGSRRIKVDLGDIEGGKKPDVPLQAEDIIKVGKRIF